MPSDTFTVKQRRKPQILRHLLLGHELATTIGFADDKFADLSQKSLVRLT
jgi:hypothetical protein